MDPRPFRLRYLNGSESRHEDVVAVRFSTLGTPTRLQLGWSDWSTPHNDCGRNFRGTGTLPPCLEILDLADRIEAAIDGRRVGEAQVFAFHRFSQDRVDLVRGEDGATVAWCDGRGWHADGLDLDGETLIEFSVSLAPAYLQTAVLTGPRARPSALAERSLTLAGVS